MDTRLGRRLGTTAAAWVLAILPSVPAVQAQIPCSYEVTAVIQGPWCGEIFGYPPTFGGGISDDGMVVGYYASCLIGPTEAFVWSAATGLVTLERPAGFTDAWAADIEGDQIVGALEMDNRFHAALWQNGEAIELGTLPGGNWSAANAISGGRIVGNWGNTITGPTHGFIWEAGVMTSLGPDLGTPSSRAYDIKKKVKVVGWMGTATSLDARAFIWDAGRVTELPAIPGGFTSEGLAISADGNTVVGVGRIIDDKTGDDFSRAFVWQDGKMVNLGTLPGFLRSGATDVDDNSLVIGRLWGGSPDSGFVCQYGVMIDLNALIPPETGVDVTIPWAISSQGQITGQGHNSDGDIVGLLLTPVEGPLGDLDGDCHVGILDLLSLLIQWGTCDGCAGDLDDDGQVGILDVLILLANWG